MKNDFRNYLQLSGSRTDAFSGQGEGARLHGAEDQKKSGQADENIPYTSMSMNEDRRKTTELSAYERRCWTGNRLVYSVKLCPAAPRVRSKSRCSETLLVEHDSIMILMSLSPSVATPPVIQFHDRILDCIPVAIRSSRRSILE